MEGQEQSSVNKPERAANGQLLPGNTANPFGRPPGTVSIVEALRRKLKEVPEGEDKRTYLEVFVDKLYEKTNQDGDVAMMKDLIDRIDGKPEQKVAVDVTERRLLLD
jgi:hypothetical protein